MYTDRGSAGTAARGLSYGFFSIIVAAAFAFVPTNASAASITVNTAQVTPGTPSCLAPTVSGFEFFVYDNELHSFDVLVSDPSYVAVAGSAGDMPIPFVQMTRRITAAGALRIHTDIDSTPLSQSMPIVITLLSAKSSGSPICLTQVTITPSAEEQTALEEIPRTVADTGAYPVAPVRPTVSGDDAAAGEAPAGAVATSIATASDSVTKAFSRVKDSVKSGACGAGNSTSRLWFIFLVLYVLSLGAIALSRPPTTEPYPLAWLFSAILIPLILLAAFWYVLSACGVSKWVPLLAAAAGVVGIIIALRGNTDQEDLDTLLLPEHEDTAPAKSEPAPVVSTPAEVIPPNLPKAPSSTTTTPMTMPMDSSSVPAVQKPTETKPTIVPEHKPEQKPEQQGSGTQGQKQGNN